MIYWMGNEDDEDQFDDDPEGKYTVTAEKLIETLTAGGKVKDSGVVEPTNNSSKTIMTEQLGNVNSRYKKSCGKEIVYLNTLKGTIDFMKKQNTTDKSNVTNTITQDEPTDAINQITFDSTIKAHVFKGNRLKRQFGVKRDLETFEENRKDYTREAGEETSGL
uniref:Ribonuclease H-like domain-containing protein n=1 Tax=Caenorhabditis tropicalis TaxID=1561998 RepID=A0A1I7UYB1_9PELO